MFLQELDQFHFLSLKLAVDIVTIEVLLQLYSADIAESISLDLFSHLQNVFLG